ncbi:MAG TPA: hypothetical protein PK014_14265 [Thermoanaerobaculia bacterium]|nr:hypothetical protein [Thermoanaerobaculia bacterium]HUM31140.1 hypothetical protein [Thermoanaerobaculia bacterium]HXK69496.1 hypothetical protein [Thermoanaerobaculia bacterium]
MALFDAENLFFSPLAPLLEQARSDGLGSLCLISDRSPQALTRLASLGWSAESVSAPADLDRSFDIILVPKYFHALGKDEAAIGAKRISSHIRESGLLAVLFPPAWFPSVWKSKASHHHIERNERLIVRQGSEIWTFTLYSNREIEALFEPLRPLQLVTLQNGMRRAIFKKP